MYVNKLALVLLVSVWFGGCASKPSGTDPVPGASSDPAAVRESIRDVVKKNQKEVVECYRAVADRKPDLEGRAVIRWDINDEGRVTEVRTVDGFNRQVERCIGEKLMGWTFPPAPANEVMRVSFPFSFDPETPETPSKSLQ